EMMDHLALELIEAAFHSGYPTDAGAVLLVESAGFEDDLQLYEAEIERIARSVGATSWRAARSQAERDALWAGRKGAFGAAGRVAPNYYLQDVVVPRTKLPQALSAVETACDSRGIKVANVFHAGDGNLHPLLMYDRSNQKEAAAVIEAGNEILQAAVDLGGTISGEHGIGYEKRGSLTRIFTTDDLATMARVREVFDPRRMLNPEKIFPAGAGCGEVR
ncbi:MAG TPA: FAD-linked oxidase C-terminal domain-containing protein, partial [Candidatus Baltobacteraceae bacterium]|nr:FAD-linked oxidase C-terminal domain-containing protein [Candidatus Baltobacteraceae bacterium]